MEQSEFLDRPKIEELRSLVLVNVYWNGKTGWSLSFIGGNKVFNGTGENFAKFLRKVQAKDSTHPRSQRNKTYQEIVNDIMDGKERTIYIWSNILNNFDKMIYNESVSSSNDSEVFYKVSTKGD